MIQKICCLLTMNTILAIELLVKAEEIFVWWNEVKIRRKKYYGQLYDASYRKFDFNDYYYNDDGQSEDEEFEWEKDYKSRADLIRHVEKKQQMMRDIYKIFGDDIPSEQNIVRSYIDSNGDILYTAIYVEK